MYLQQVIYGFFSDSNQHLSFLVLAAQNIRSNIEHGATVLQSYVSSLQVRTDTKFSLLLGILLGLSVVAAIAAYPGKPIDYTGVGEPMIRRGFRIVCQHCCLCKSEPRLPASFIVANRLDGRSKVPIRLMHGIINYVATANMRLQRKILLI